MYYVEVPVRGYSTVLVQAGSADEAVEIVMQGGGEPLESTVHRSGRGKARLREEPTARFVVDTADKRDSR